MTSPQVISSHGIGGSEIAAALGESPYRTPLELWLEKTGRTSSFKGNERTAYGHLIEPVLRAWYVERHGIAVWVPPASLFDPQRPWARATPDGIALNEGLLKDDPTIPGVWDHGFEAKQVGWRQAHRWGEEATDEVPREYLLQAMWGMAVTGQQRWALVASIGGDPPTEYFVERDDELIELMRQRAEAFWACVQADTAPPIDGSPAYAAYLAERYPWSDERILPRSERTDSLARQLQLLSASIGRLEADEARVENELRAAIGAASGVDTADGRITYRPRQGGTNWKNVAAAIAAAHDVSPDEIAALCATNKNTPSRPLLRPRAWSIK